MRSTASPRRVPSRLCPLESHPRPEACVTSASTWQLHTLLERKYRRMIELTVFFHHTFFQKYFLVPAKNIHDLKRRLSKERSKPGSQPPGERMVLTAPTSLLRELEDAISQRCSGQFVRWPGSGALARSGPCRYMLLMPCSRRPCLAGLRTLEVLRRRANARDWLRGLLERCLPRTSSSAASWAGWNEHFEQYRMFLKSILNIRVENLNINI